MDELQDAPQERVTTGRVVTENPMARIETPSKEYKIPDETAYSDLSGSIAEPARPEPSGEAPLESPVEVSDATEGAALIADIKAALKSGDLTVATFAPKCRDAGLLKTGVQLAAAPIESLREILANVDDIITGNYIPLA